MPQWEFLDFLAEHARKSPHFELRMQTEAEALIDEGGTIAGVRANPLAGLAHRLVRQADDQEDRHARRDLHLDIDQHGFDAAKCHGLDRADHWPPAPTTQTLTARRGRLQEHFRNNRIAGLASESGGF
jgi:hypothetical protein